MTPAPRPQPKKAGAKKPVALHEQSTFTSLVSQLSQSQPAVGPAAGADIDAAVTDLDDLLSDTRPKK